MDKIAIFIFFAIIGVKAAYYYSEDIKSGITAEEIYVSEAVKTKKLAED